MREPGLRALIRTLIRRDSLCLSEEDCPDRIYRCTKCHATLGRMEVDCCSACGADWKWIDVSHGPECPRSTLAEDMDSELGQLVDRCASLRSAMKAGFHITLADVTCEEFRVISMMEEELGRFESDRQAQFAARRSS